MDYSYIHEAIKPVIVVDTLEIEYLNVIFLKVTPLLLDCFNAIRESWFPESEPCHYAQFSLPVVKMGKGAIAIAGLVIGKVREAGHIDTDSMYPIYFVEDEIQVVEDIVRKALKDEGLPIDVVTTSYRINKNNNERIMVI